MKIHVKILFLIALLMTLARQLSAQQTAHAPLSVEINVKNLPIVPKFVGNIEDVKKVIDTPLVVNYTVKKVNDSFTLSYDCPYVQKAAQANNSIIGLEYSHTPFHFHLPVLTIQVKNNGHTPLSITHLAVVVDTSVLDKNPILVLADKTVNQLVFINEGWGKIINPQINISVVDMGTYDTGEVLTKVKVNKRFIATFDSLAIIPIDSFIPSKLKKERAVGVFGEVTFNNEDNQTRSLSYRTRIILSANATAPPAKEEIFNLFLEAGKSGYTENVPIKTQIAIGETKTFNITLATNKTSDFFTKFEFIGANNEKLNTTFFKALVFMPRSIARLNNLSKR